MLVVRAKIKKSPEQAPISEAFIAKLQTELDRIPSAFNTYKTRVKNEDSK